MTYDLTGVDAAILAGGLGARLRPAVGDVPKVLAEVAGRPFLAYLLDQLAEAGIRHVVLCTGYGAERVAAVVGAAWGRLRVSYSPEPTPRGTGGALRAALALMSSPTVLALNGDSYCRADLATFLRRHEQTQARATILLAQVADVGRFGQVICDAEGRVTQFVEKGASGGPGWINAGVYLFRADGLAELPADRPLSLERESLPGWVGRGLHGHPGGSAFLDIGIPESYRLAEGFLREQRSFPV